MQQLFGIPMDSVAVVLALVVGIGVAIVTTLALRNRVLLRMGLRNVLRRRGRAALIVVGLMLGTTIISSALVTGDTMSRTIRSSVTQSLGHTDELVSARGADVSPMLAQSTRVQYFDERHLGSVERALRATGEVDGVAPAIIEPVALQDLTSRQTESRVSLFATDPARMAGFGAIRDSRREPRSLTELAFGEVYLNRDAADQLSAREGDEMRLLAGRRSARVRVKAIVDYDGTGTDGAAVLMPLARAQALMGRRGQLRHILVSNRGGELSGAAATGAVVRGSAAALAPLGLELQEVKREGLELADEQGGRLHLDLHERSAASRSLPACC